MLLQKNETVEAMQGYLMQSIKAELEETHALYMRRKNMKQYNIFKLNNSNDFITIKEAISKYSVKSSDFLTDDDEKNQEILSDLESFVSKT